ncbi:hypothetical protein [Chitinophaga sp.]|uniref:hypothetical protein n=1 Tax=Chitinophaga sp. TaxID=1869181 RepID=UPI0031D37CFF
MKILSLVNNASGCDYHRVRLPITYLQQAGYIQGVPAGLSFEDSMKECDILFYNRLPYNTSLDQILDFRKKYGFKIIVDLDDYWKLYPGHLLEGIWKAQKLEQHILRNVSVADAVICTSDRLYQKILPYNGNVHVVPNGLPFDDDQFIPRQSQHEDNAYVYVGGGSHYWDLRLLESTMRKLARHNFTNQVVLAGVAEDAEVYRKMGNMLGASGQLSGFRTVQHLPVSSYMDLYEHGTIALAPLIANEFNAHKSNLKVLEAGCKSMPIIVSNTGPYLDDVCPFLMRADKASDFYRWIQWCEDNPNHVADNGAALAAYVRQNYDIRILNYLRLDAFKSVL